MTIETKHGDHVVRYDEDKNEWKAPGLDLSAPSFATLKKKIGDYEAKERKLGSGVLLRKLDGYSYGSKIDAPQVRATMLDKDFVEGASHVAVWISHLADGRREKAGIHALILDTPENLATIAEANRLDKEAAATKAKADKLRADIPRLTVDQLKSMALEVKP